MPQFVIEDVEDAYTYYVIMNGISESLFWFADIAFLRGVLLDKNAYGNWKGYALEKYREKLRR